MQQAPLTAGGFSICRPSLLNRIKGTPNHLEHQFTAAVESSQPCSSTNPFLQTSLPLCSSAPPALSMGQVCFEFQRQYRFHHTHHGPCLISLAFLAATGFNSCGCAITSDTLAVGVSSTLVGSHVCCISTITAIARTSDSFQPSSLSQTTV